MDKSQGEPSREDAEVEYECWKCYEHPDGCNVCYPVVVKEAVNEN